MQGTFPVCSAGITAAFEFLEAGLDRLGVGRPVFFRFSVILDELCANMIRHDGSLTEADEFSVELGVSDGVAVMIVSDPGKPFDPQDSYPSESREIGGHGINLIHGLASGVSYERSGGRNRITVKIGTGAQIS